MPYKYKTCPQPIIVIEDEWDVPQEVIEKAIVGLISHETIEWILAKMEAEGEIPDSFLIDIHSLIGTLSIEDYVNEESGLPLKERKRVEGT